MKSGAVPVGFAFVYTVMLLGGAAAQSFDFFYFVVQWPGSYCDLNSACCYPNAGKPASNFSIHGLWPNYDDGSYPSNCDSSDTFDKALVSDLIPTLNKEWGSLACPSSDSTSFWSHEWVKHGTCSGLDEHEYFSSALGLFQSFNFISALKSSGITPNGQMYSITKVQNVLASALSGHIPGIECNTNTDGNNQLYQVYICVDTDGATLIDCPVFPQGTCKTQVTWPKF